MPILGLITASRRMEGGGGIRFSFPPLDNTLFSGVGRSRGWALVRVTPGARDEWEWLLSVVEMELAVRFAPAAGLGGEG